uniref:Uncharacterized protein n=1 Tax=viral metagenome TaxID=1070528 RepID=A0A6M3II91_9ZZZZ
MEIVYREQRIRGAARDEEGCIVRSFKPWVDFEPVIDGASMELPAHSVFVAGQRFDLAAETMEIAEGHLYLDGDGCYHFVAQEFVGEVGSTNNPGAVSRIDGWGHLRLLWIEGETVYVLRSVE